MPIGYDEFYRTICFQAQLAPLLANTDVLYLSVSTKMGTPKDKNKYPTFLFLTFPIELSFQQTLISMDLPWLMFVFHRSVTVTSSFMATCLVSPKPWQLMCGHQTSIESLMIETKLLLFWNKSSSCMWYCFEHFVERLNKTKMQWKDNPWKRSFSYLQKWRNQMKRRLYFWLVGSVDAT